MKRRTLIAGAGAALGTLALSRSGRGAPPDVFQRFERSLAHVHGELAARATGIATSIEDPRASAATDRAIAAFTRELLDHHKSEDAFFFPGFRAAGRLRSSDVAFLAMKDEEHVAIHRTCIELRDAGAAHARKALARPAWRQAVRSRIATLQALSRPHFAEEQATLTAAHVETFIGAAELGAIYRDMAKNWHRR